MHDLDPVDDLALWYGKDPLPVPSLLLAMALRHAFYCIPSSEILDPQHSICVMFKIKLGKEYEEWMTISTYAGCRVQYDWCMHTKK